MVLSNKKTILINLPIFLAVMILFGCSKSPAVVPSSHTSPDDTAGSHQTATMVPGSVSQQRQQIIDASNNNIGAPYAWGGTSPAQGFDCSGLVVYAYSCAGIPLPRTAIDQMKKGRPISLAKALPGDLVFFSAPGKKTYIHVGIYTGANAFIHAPGKGRQITRSNLDNSYFRRHFLGARTFL